jgi:hypothetical protein
MREVVLSLLIAATAGATPPDGTALGPTTSVVRDRVTRRPKALFGLRLPAPGAGEAGARAAVMSVAETLGMAPCELGQAVVTHVGQRTIVSFELVVNVAGERLIVASRRVAATLTGDTAITIHSDLVPFAAPSALGPVSARDAQHLVHTQYGGLVTRAEPRLLVLGANLAEPVWRMTVAVIPLADHRVVDVSRRTGRVVRESPGLADGARVGVRR